MEIITAERLNYKGENRVKLSFTYNPKIIEKIRKIPGATFSKALKSWHIPFDNEYVTRLNILFEKKFEIIIKLGIPQTIGKTEKKNEKITLSEISASYLSIYTDTMKLKRLSASTYKVYSEFFIEFLEKYNNEDINEFNYQQIHTYIKNRALTLGYSRKKQMIAAIKFYYEKVGGRDKLFFHLSKECKPILLPVYLTFPAICKLLEKIHAPHDKLILFLAYHVNLTPDEIANLTIDLSALWPHE